MNIYYPFWLSRVLIFATTMLMSQQKFARGFVSWPGSMKGPVSTKLYSSFPETTTADKILSVTLEKPLGMILEEVEEGQPKGVYILELSEDGSAAASEWNNQLLGLTLAKVMGNDVSNLGFDDVMDQLIAAPSPLNLDFVVPVGSGREELLPITPPVDDEKDEFPLGSAVLIKVLDGKDNKDTVIEAKVGDNLRAKLLENNIEVYKGLKQKLGNCGGGGQCTFCAADFVESEGWCERSSYEDQRLAKSPNARLTCLNNIQGPATIRL